MKIWNRTYRFLCYIGKHKWREMTKDEFRFHYARYQRGGPVVFHVCDRCRQTR